MSDNDDKIDNPDEVEAPAKVSMKDSFAPGAAGEPVGALFSPDEMDIYTNKVSLEAYIFHSKDVDYALLDHLVYNTADYSVTVMKKDGTQLDLGVKIQWLIRAYFIQAREVQIVQTKDGESINGVVLPLKIKDREA